VTPFSAWQTFYEIVGSSAAALTGLQFIAIALVTDRPKPGVDGTIAAFGTPTIVHFGSVLLLSTILSAPWPRVGAPLFLSGLGGATGFCYVIVVARRTREQTGYQPVLEDWLCHVVLPAVAYGGVAVAAVAARGHIDRALFGIAAAALLLLFIGIHNAWDTVTYLVTMRGQGSDDRVVDRPRAHSQEGSGNSSAGTKRLGPND
jgi:hypothetical protein